MMALRELKVLADDAARKEGDVIVRPKGVRGEELFFYAHPSDFRPGDVIGLPYGYWVNIKTGATRICTGDESDLLTDREYLDSFQPIPE